MLGRASLFQLAGTARNPDPETRAILAKGLRPFILRRTKQQVAKDLPDKTEQTLYCELEPEQRATLRRVARSLPPIVAQDDRARSA